jgi:hypothetical protein
MKNEEWISEAITDAYRSGPDSSGETKQSYSSQRSNPKRRYENLPDTEMK